MDKLERKRMGAWISLLGGGCFVLGALAAVYIAFFMKPETANHFLSWLVHTLHPSAH
jgi:hypothetical protein